MALTKIGGWRDWLLGAIIPDPTSGGKGTVGIQAVTLVDQTGSPTVGGAVTIVGPLGSKTAAASVAIVAQGGAASGAAPSGNPVEVAGVVAFGDGSVRPINVNVDGTQLVVGNSAGGAGSGPTFPVLAVGGQDGAVARIFLTDIQGGLFNGGHAFSNITTSTTTQVKTGAGVVHLINVNTKGTVASTIKGYDATSGTSNPIFSIDSLNLSGPFQFDIAFSVGLRIISTGTVAPDFTVAYR